jgi:hypothetical protein
MTDPRSLEEELNRFRAKRRGADNGANGDLATRFWPFRRKRSGERDEAREPLVAVPDTEEVTPSTVASLPVPARDTHTVSLSDDDDNQSEIGSDIEIKTWWTLDTAIACVKLLLYVVGQVLAIVAQFGAVFFSVSLLFFICTNLRNRKRKKGELSAYSVFNPRCEPIHGTVDAERLQNELSFGAINL